MASNGTVGTSRLVLTEEFRGAFKEVAFARRKQLTSALATVFELPETHPMWGETWPFWGEVKALPDDHPFRAELVRRHGQMPNLQAQPLLQFDASSAKQVLVDCLGKKGFSLYDHDAPYRGGYPFIGWRTADFYPKHPSVDARLMEVWNIEPLVRAYWTEPSNETRYREVSDFPFYVDREAKTVRERAHHSLGFKLINVAGALAYQERLITLNFPAYALRKVVSDGKTRRYAKRLPNGIFLALHANFSEIESDLKLGYVSLPELSVEIFDESASGKLKPESYLCFQTDFPIARVQLPVGFFLKDAVTRRMGSIGPAETEERIKRGSFYHSDVRAQYLQLCLPIIEEILGELVP